MHWYRHRSFFFPQIELISHKQSSSKAWYSIKISHIYRVTGFGKCFKKENFLNSKYFFCKKAVSRINRYEKQIKYNMNKHINTLLLSFFSHLTSVVLHNHRSCWHEPTSTWRCIINVDVQKQAGLEWITRNNTTSNDFTWAASGSIFYYCLTRLTKKSKSYTRKNLIESSAYVWYASTCSSMKLSHKSFFLLSNTAFIWFYVFKLNFYD